MPNDDIPPPLLRRGLEVDPDLVFLGEPVKCECGTVIESGVSCRTCEKAAVEKRGRMREVPREGSADTGES